MFANFLSWWSARLSELLPHDWISAVSRAKDGVIVDVSDRGDVSVSLRRQGQLTPISLGAAAREPGGTIVLVRPPPHAVLVKTHTLPTVPTRQLDQILRHELARITPFDPDSLYWRWDGQSKSANGTRTEVTLTMVPRMAVAAGLGALDSVGLKPHFIETGTQDSPRLLPALSGTKRSGGAAATRILALSCACLALIALALPPVFQTVDFYHTEAAIKELQPTIGQVDALRRNNAAGDAGRDVLAKETERTGDVLRILATVTRVLPDDTYLTDFSLRERQMTLSGRSASAPRLITGLSADPSMRDTAFAAPVTRMEGAANDIFSIKAEVAK